MRKLFILPLIGLLIGCADDSDLESKYNGLQQRFGPYQGATSNQQTAVTDNLVSISAPGQELGSGLVFFAEVGKESTFTINMVSPHDPQARITARIKGFRVTEDRHRQELNTNQLSISESGRNSWNLTVKLPANALGDKTYLRTTVTIETNVTSQNTEVQKLARTMSRDRDITLAIVGRPQQAAAAARP